MMATITTTNPDAVVHPIPDGQSTNKLGSVLARVLMIVVALILLAVTLLRGEKATKRPSAGEQVSRVMEITKEVSPPIDLFDPTGTPYRYYYEILTNDVSFVVMFNGGEANGGWDRIIPAKDDRPPNWEWVKEEFLPTNMLVKIHPSSSKNETRFSYTLITQSR